MEQFEQALRDLEELFPQKYGMWNRESLGGEKEFVILGSQDKLIPIFLITQDDIDSILAEIGWVYGIEPILKNGELKYFYSTHKIGSATSDFADGEFDTKIEASRQALIEVVKLEKERRK
jgi:hypothetical protein